MSSRRRDLRAEGASRWAGVHALVATQNDHGGDSSLVSVVLLVGNQGDDLGETCRNECARVRGSPWVFAVIVTQLVTQRWGVS